MIKKKIDVGDQEHNSVRIAYNEKGSWFVVDFDRPSVFTDQIIFICKLAIKNNKVKTGGRK